MKTFVMLRRPGAGWVIGKTTREQPLWDEHAAFMDALFETGAVVLAGPYADHNGALLILTAEDTAAAIALFKDDPWTIHDILGVDGAREWLIYLDSREQPTG